MFRLRFGKNYVVICYAVAWQHVIGMVCVLCAVLSAIRTQHTIKVSRVRLSKLLDLLDATRHHQVLLHQFYVFISFV